MENTTKPQDQSKKINFRFRPLEVAKGDFSQFAVEKSENGSKRKYLQGITSGIKIDGHEERMTERCIKSFMNQANSGDILLYADTHGINSSDDIGILRKANIEPDGNWSTLYRLYDEKDDIGDVKKEKINDIWKQSNGLPPYKRPMQKGFSIEGIIPEDAILSHKIDKDGNMTHRVIDDVDLLNGGGVVLVPKPAYKESIAHSVYKALGEVNPYQEQSVKKSVKNELRAMIDEGAIQDSYYTKKWDVQDALDTIITKIVNSGDSDNEKKQKLKIAFNEYQDLMIELVMQSQGLFTSENETGDANAYNLSDDGTEVRKSELFRALSGELNHLEKIIKNWRT